MAIKARWMRGFGGRTVFMPPYGEWLHADTNWNVLARKDDAIERKLIVTIADAMTEYEVAAMQKYAPLAASITAMARACKEAPDETL